MCQFIYYFYCSILLKMKKIFLFAPCFVFFACSKNNYQGSYLNNVGHVLKIQDSSFIYITYQPGNAEYFSKGYLFKKGDSLVLVSKKKDTLIYNMFELDRVALKIKNSNTLFNKTYKFKRNCK